MEEAPENAPTQPEVETQLGRMLESDVFASSPRLSALLRYIVCATLPDKEGKTDPVMLTEHQVGFNVLGEYYDSKASAVRVNATFLRKRIRKYYANNGAGDRVRIDIPAGGYRAVFSFNHASPAGKLCARARSLVGAFVPSEREHRSLILFREAIDADPNYAPAHAALAEAELMEMVYRRSIPPHEPLAAAEASAKEAIRLQPKLWRAHIALGAVHCCRHRWAEAELSFDAALTLAPNAKRDHSWYAAYLLATGGEREEREALRLARARAEAKPEDISGQIALGFFLYLARQFEEAEEFLRELTERFPESWLARIVLACVYLAGDRAVEALVTIDEAYAILNRQSELSEPFDNVFPGLYNLCCLRGGHGGNKHVARESMSSASTSDYWAVYHVQNGADEVPEGRWKPEPGHSDRHIPYWTPLQLALGNMGLGNTEAALAALTRAVDEGDPLTLWLRRWPLFDELRGDPAFQALVGRMNFPLTSRNATPLS